MSYTIMDSLPSPRDWQKTPGARDIVERALTLCVVGAEMEGFRRLVQEQGEIRCDGGEEDPSRRVELAAEIDVLVAHEVYGLSRNDMLYILDPANLLGVDCGIETSKALRNWEIREYSEYRTQQLVLEAWDRFVTDGTIKRHAA